MERTRKVSLSVASKNDLDWSLRRSVSEVLSLKDEKE